MVIGVPLSGNIGRIRSRSFQRLAQRAPGAEYMLAHGRFGDAVHLAHLLRRQIVQHHELETRTLHGRQLRQHSLRGLRVHGVRTNRDALLALLRSPEVAAGETTTDLVESRPDLLRLFGKPEIRGKRRLGVALALGPSLDEARARARAAAGKIRLHA